MSPVAILSEDGGITHVNPACAAVLRQEPAWLLGRNVTELLHPVDRARIRCQFADLVAGRPASGFVELRVRARPNLEWRTIEAVAENLLDDPTVAGVLVSIRDVTEQRAQQQSLADIAYRDALTGLPNRARIIEELASILDVETHLAVGFLGIDRFSLINDSLGHTHGDRVLQIVSKRIRALVPATHLVGRFDGNVLVFLVKGEAADDAESIAWRTIERVREPMFVNAHELQLSLSAGIVRRDASSSAEGLFRDASAALHRAKQGGGGRVELFENGMRREAIARLELEANLRRAISSTGLALAFQPIVRLADREPIGSEALVRWHHRGKTILPAQFIPIAEQTGLIIPLGEWIINEAVRLTPRAPGGRVSINLSARQLAAPGLVETISRALAVRALPAAAVDFEITETFLVEQFEFAVGVLASIRRLGSRVGLDDFGTGYSSLGYLRRIPIDFLKLDRSLIADLDVDRQARSVAGAVIVMAEALGIEVVAEGVEREAQAAALLDLGASRAQGFLFGTPTELVPR